jgi:RNA polymerase sigma-70 factor (ECF subfamily)
VSHTPTPNTSESLLGRLRQSPTDGPAWTEFVDRYAPIIYDWCRQWRLQDADARDVTQGVLTRLIRRLRDFQYDPTQSFRKWLWTVARHAWIDFLSDRSRADAPNPSRSEALREVAAREDLLSRLDAEFDRELLEEASGRVRLRVEPRTWDAFRLTAIESLSGAEAGERLAMTIAAVFKAKSKVLKMLREELGRLNGNPYSHGVGE